MAVRSRSGGQARRRNPAVFAEAARPRPRRASFRGSTAPRGNRCDELLCGACSSIQVCLSTFWLGIQHDEARSCEWFLASMQGMSMQTCSETVIIMTCWYQHAPCYLCCKLGKKQHAIIRRSNLLNSMAHCLLSLCLSSVNGIWLQQFHVMDERQCVRSHGL